MNKKQLIDEVSYLLDKSPVEVKKIVDTTFEVIASQLVAGNPVSIYNFAQIRPRLVIGGKRFDILAQQVVDLPPTNVVRIRPYAALKRKINPPCATGNCPAGGDE